MPSKLGVFAKYFVTFIAGGVLGAMAMASAIKQRLKAVQSQLLGSPDMGNMQGMSDMNGPMIPPKEAMQMLIKNPQLMEKVMKDPSVPQEAKAMLKEFQKDPQLMERMLDKSLAQLNEGGIPTNAATISPVGNQTTAPQFSYPSATPYSYPQAGPAAYSYPHPTYQSVPTAIKASNLAV